MPTQPMIRSITIAVTAAGMSIALTACTTGPNQPPTAQAAYIGHIHGLGADPATGETYAATHTGVWLVPTSELPPSYPVISETSAPVQIAERWQDTMGFTVARPGLLLGSGHPDLEEQPDLDPPNLGLISSVDGAVTWDTISLRGEVDFHDLEVIELADGELRIYGYDAGATTVRTSNDSGVTWTAGAAMELRDLAADPAEPDRVYATTAQGLLVSNDAGRTFLPVPNAPALYLLTIAPDTGEFIGIDTDNTVWISPDGAEWNEQGRTRGAPEAMAYIGGDAPWLLIADDRGIVATEDYSATETVLLPRQE